MALGKPSCRVTIRAFVLASVVEPHGGGGLSGPAREDARRYGAAPRAPEGYEQAVVEMMT